MIIAKLFDRLSRGQLSNLAIATDSPGGPGTIDPAAHPKLVHCVNEGLLRLYGRFVLSEKELLLEQVAGLTSYHLKREFAESAGANVPHAYIKDLPDDPFREDALKILKVFGRDGPRVLNDQADPASLFTPYPTTLQVPAPVHGEPLSVIYQARHPELDDRPDHIINQNIELPFFLENALQNFVGYKVYSDMNGQENILKGQEYLAAYEALCTDVETRDLANQTFHTTHSKLEQRGFA